MIAGQMVRFGLRRAAARRIVDHTTRRAERGPDTESRDG